MKTKSTAELQALLAVGAMLALLSLVFLIDGQNKIMAATAGPSEVAKQKAPPFLLPQATGGGGGSVMVHGVTAGSGYSGPIFMGGGVPEYRMPRDGTIQKMRILIPSNSDNGAVVVTLFVNGSSTLLTTTIPPGSTADVNVSGAVNVFDGDKVSVIMDSSAAISGVISITVSYEVL